MKYVDFAVQGNCEVCKQRIEDAAMNVSGVSSAIWNIRTGKLNVGFNPEQTNIDEISKVISLNGHNTERYKADRKKHEALPECCR